ncbi:unnamed protein product [Adineta ricciae]|uniref:Uncharacterized protein n=1 Tax=Adineta ricciae TaxID=249248 RepID=A0A815H9G6_ADIRI|nr:unnamed protein product [Adineta ricciae]CAF1351111.1 unnamed protein product [Adineta ricciae]
MIIVLYGNEYNGGYADNVNPDLSLEFMDERARPSYCSDKHWNVDESDVDCGGPTCPAGCDRNQKYISSTDCMNMTCDLSLHICKNWIMSGKMNVGQLFHIATLLLNGNVLVTGGSQQDFGFLVAAKAELYDPVIENWTIVDSMNVARIFHKATLLADGSDESAAEPDGKSYLECFGQSTHMFKLMIFI